jgi:hypothetical protein
MSEVVRDGQRLVALEIALARRELRELVMAYAIAAGLVAAGGLLIMLALLVAVPSLIVALVPWKWQAAAVWAGGYALLGIVLVLIARYRFKVRMPLRTIESLKENKEWVLRHVRSNSR